MRPKLTHQRRSLLNDWALEGNWTIERQSGLLNSAPGAIAYRFHSRDLHLVLAASKPVRFRVTIDGKAPGADAGVDVKADGSGMVTNERLYQLVRQRAKCATARSASNSSIPARRRSPSPSADQRSLSQIIEMIFHPSSGWRKSWIELMPRRSTLEASGAVLAS